MAKLWILFALFALANGDDAATNNLPTELRDPTMFCEGCYGTLMEVADMMESDSDKTLMQRINWAMGKVCHTDNLRKYVFSPPKMVRVSPQRALNPLKRS